METIEKKKTGFEWCRDVNVRILDLNDWETTSSSETPEDAYFTEKISGGTFQDRLIKCKVKANSQPRKTEKYLTYRMYGLVPYNISPIQKGIQFGHAVVDYGQNIGKGSSLGGLHGFVLPNIAKEKYMKWANEDKTFIILDGGTTNNNPERLGTINQSFNTLRDAGIFVQPFFEPDLGDQLSAFCFLVDERVYDRITYPDFIPETLPYSRKKPSEKVLEELDARNNSNRIHWVEKIGGAQNVFLREFLKPLRLA